MYLQSIEVIEASRFIVRAGRTNIDGQMENV